VPGKSTKIGGRWFSASASPLTRQPFPCLYSGCANCISKLPGKPTLEQSQSKPLTRQKIIRTKNNKASSLATITYPARVLPIEKNPNNIVFFTRHVRLRKTNANHSIIFLPGKRTQHPHRRIPHPQSYRLTRQAQPGCATKAPLCLGKPVPRNANGREKISLSIKPAAG